MANAPLEFNPTLLDQVEHVLLANEDGAGLLRGLCMLGVWRCNNADANVGVDRMREAKPVADYRTVFLRS